MVKCDFCGGQMKPGHGITFVTSEAKVLHFCKSKCRKLFKLGRKKQKWITKKKKFPK